MRIEQTIWTKAALWKNLVSERGIQPQIVFLFGDNNALRKADAVGFVHMKYPHAVIFGGTSAYEINQDGFCENSIVVTAVEFSHARLQFAKAPLTAHTSEESAQALARQFVDKENISHIFMLCDGHNVNGGRFVNELTKALPGIPITGGMAADKSLAEPGYLILDGGELSNKCAVAVAFDKSIKAGYGYGGGWDSFGIDRKITRSDGKYVYEVDGLPALALYKRYLGDQARNLPTSAHNFPAFLKETVNSAGVVRSVIQIDENENALIFASEMPQGWYFRLMKANLDRLTEGATLAAQSSVSGVNTGRKFLALMVSCLGRKLMMKRRVEDEIENAAQVLGGNSIMCGFYSLGEVCPLGTEKGAQFHNQTMTITTLSHE